MTLSRPDWDALADSVERSLDKIRAGDVTNAEKNKIGLQLHTRVEQLKDSFDAWLKNPGARLHIVDDDARKVRLLALTGRLLREIFGVNPDGPRLGHRKSDGQPFGSPRKATA